MRRLQILPWLAAVAMTAFLPASALAQDVLKLAVGAPGQLGHRRPGGRPARRHLQEARPRTRAPLYARRRRDHAGRDLRQRRDRDRGRHRRRDGRLRQGRAGAHPRGRNDRNRRSLLVRAGGLADQSFKDARRQDRRLFDQRRLDPHRRCSRSIKHFGVNAKPVATGAAAVTLTQAMSGQIDVGWASPPFGIEQLDQGQIRMIARGSDAPSRATRLCGFISSTPMRSRSASDVIDRFMRAYRESLRVSLCQPRRHQALRRNTAK